MDEIKNSRRLVPDLRGIETQLPILAPSTFIRRNSTASPATRTSPQGQALMRFHRWSLLTLYVGKANSALLGSLPIGVTDFSSICADADAYFDRSEYLVKLEKRGPLVRALRPKGFGKSLFLSSLALLHDCSTTESEFYTAFRVRNVEA